MASWPESKLTLTSQSKQSLDIAFGIKKINRPCFDAPLLRENRTHGDTGNDRLLIRASVRLWQETMAYLEQAHALMLSILIVECRLD